VALRKGFLHREGVPNKGQGGGEGDKDLKNGTKQTLRIRAAEEGFCVEEYKNQKRSGSRKLNIRLLGKSR